MIDSSVVAAIGLVLALLFAGLVPSPATELLKEIRKLMVCHICDQKPANCNCNTEERRLYAETQDLEEKIERLRPEIERLRSENARLRGLCELAPKQPVSELRS